MIGIVVKNVEDKEEPQDLKDNLQQVTMGIIDISIDDLPIRY